MNRLTVACASALFLVACSAMQGSPASSDAPAASSAATAFVQMDLGKPA
ncbi:MAG: hypothetical protein NXI31_14490 [bacterium]|nr:hypothetical protein [bacterium]